MKGQLLILLPIVLFAFGLTGCQQPRTTEDSENDVQDTIATEADPQPDFTIVPGERIGLIDLNTATEAAVLNAYGDQAQKDSIYLGEGIFEPGVVVFKGTKNQVELYWDPAMGIHQPGYVTIYGKDGQTDWKTPNDITIGTALEEVEHLNGKPFEFYGFGWDFGGYVNNWNGGQLENQGFGLRFEPAEDAETPMELFGEVIISSDDPSVRQTKATVNKMTFSSPHPSPIAMMQGGWRSTTDEGYEIIIEGDQMRHYNNQRLTYTTTIEPDPGCQSEACAITGTAPEGFCFIEKDEFDAQCNLIITADLTTLEYTAIGAAGGSLVFERVD